MPFKRPTLTDLRNATAQDINSALPNADALLRYSNLGILGDVQAGMTHLMYGYLDWIALQGVPFTATDEYLEAWGSLKNVYKKAATQATGTVVFLGTNGVDIPTGTPITRSDGTEYASTADAVVVGGSATISVIANADASGLTGAFGNCVAGTQLSLGQSISGVTSTGVSMIVTGGADLESEDDFRTRVLYAFQNPPQGGDELDYVEWALSVSGVTRAWCLGNQLGAGTVTVYVMMDNANAGNGGFPVGTSGVAALEKRAIPATGDLLTVADYIYPLRPITALVYIVSPATFAVNLSISGVTAKNRAAVQAAMSSQLNQFADPRGSSVVLDKLWQAAANVSADLDFIITNPSSDITCPLGYLPVLGMITWS